MAIYRLITKNKSEECFRALSVQADNTSDAKERGAKLLDSGDELVAVDVKAGKIWVNVLGQPLKGADIQKHSKAPDGTLYEGDSYTRQEASGSGGKKPMSQTQGNVAQTPCPLNTSNSSESGFGSAVGKAFMQAIFVCVFRVFTIPWTIWEGATYRLAERQDNLGNTGQTQVKTEFPIFEWFKYSLDGVILLSWPLGFVFSLIASMGSYRDGGWIFFLGLCYTYFGVIGWSLFKEALTMLLSIALNVEKINYKTLNNQSK